MENKKFYLGLDIGTNSLGYAASDEQYKLLTYKGKKDVWGSYTFDEGKPADERRAFRVARRRLERKKQRTQLLNELFAKEIAKVDENFFIRIKESALWAEDKSLETRFAVFGDKDYTDKEYHTEYKTIHHLINELMESDKPHDVRLVYLACKYILSHRGHFLSPVSEDKLDELTCFNGVYDEFMGWFEGSTPWDNPASDIEKILRQKIGVSKKLELFKELLWGGRKPAKNDEAAVDIYCVVNLICGGTVALSDIFENDEYKKLENNKIKLGDSDKVDAVMTEITQADAQLIDACKKIFDWALLIDILGGEKTVSKAKIKIYEQHEKDLRWLKRIIRTYLPDKIYEVFKMGNAKKAVANYVAYSGNFKSVKTIGEHNKCTQEDFCKYLLKLLEKLEVSEDDREELDSCIARMKDASFCPKQVTTDNRVIPYQLYYYELRIILEKASAYLPFLNEKDEYGTVAEKILSIMKFRVPYYVGPLNKNRNEHAWIVRKAEGRILPWNFDEMVNKEESEKKFICRMTCTCTYLYGCDVLPKCSMIYEKFLVLNEINSVKINNAPIDVATKQQIFEELFMKRKSVKLKDINELLVANNKMKDEDVISGISDTVKPALKSYHNFKNLLNSGKLTEIQVEEIILRITCTEDSKRLAKWLKNEFGLADDDVKYIVKNCRCKDFGSLSKDLLTEIVPVDVQTGELTGRNIITEMWEENLNLMQLLSDNYGYRKAIDLKNEEYCDGNSLTLAQRLIDLRISPAVRRAIVRTVDVVKDITKCLKKTPDKIFIETARELDDASRKGRTSDSRKTDLTKLYEDIIKNHEQLKEEANELLQLLQNQENDRLRREKIYLYFRQLGKCMYSGKAIDFSELVSDSKAYDIDHIFPQAKIKDNSIDNMVLVLSEYNGAKSDTYPISSEIRSRMSGMWYGYFRAGLITEKKYKRLIRSEPFSDEELAGFISRQLVETRQSTKAAAKILKEYYPETEIVYVKAGLVSEFRQENGIYKCRAVNDLHHAKDAYLNIVMGNVYNVKFTKNPLNFIKSVRNGSNEKYSLHLSSLLWTDKYKTTCRHIERGGVIAWDGDGSSLQTVLETYNKKTVICNRYTHIANGGLFDQMPLKKSESDTDALIPLKKNLPTKRYGGYNSPGLACYILVKYYTEKGGSDIVFVPLERLYYKENMKIEQLREIAHNALVKIITLKKGDSITRIELPFGKRIIKPFTTLQLDDIQVYLRGKDGGGKYIVVSSAIPLFLSAEAEEYIRKIAGFLEKTREGKISRKEPVYEFDLISKEKNIQVYKEIVRKLSAKPYNKMYTNVNAVFADGNALEKFSDSTSREQIDLIDNLIKYLKNGGTTNLKLLGGSGQSGQTKIPASVKAVTKTYSNIRIVDKSPSGLIIRKSDNLAEMI